MKLPSVRHSIAAWFSFGLAFTMVGFAFPSFAAEQPVKEHAQEQDSLLEEALHTSDLRDESASHPNASEEEVVDFEYEETESTRQTRRILAAAGASPHGGNSGTGLKLFVDLLAEYPIGAKKFEFRPNHFYVLVQGQVKDDLSVILHISDDPVFFELTWNITPRLALKAGKLLVPFGTNEFHHIVGGRVDERSLFLPETWGDYGLGVSSHVFFDGEIVHAQYTAYLVNGFEGQKVPVIGTGDARDNNLFKGVGTRLQLDIGGKIVLTGSAYFDMWDAKNRHQIIFYGLGGEIPPGILDVPILRKLRLRGEWARGEIQLPGKKKLRGILRHSFARAGYYVEGAYPIVDFFFARFRMGRINPDNRVTDNNDLTVIEPAVLFHFGKVILTLAYQMTLSPGQPHNAKKPADILYGKFFLQF